jgi:hypothetical protein
MYVPFSVSCVLFVCKCVLLPPGVNPIAVKCTVYHIIYHIKSYHIIYHIISYPIIRISYVVIFVDVIGKVIHRKWEAAKLLDVCMIILIIFCMIQPSVVSFVGVNILCCT